MQRRVFSKFYKAQPLLMNEEGSVRKKGGGLIGFILGGLKTLCFGIGALFLFSICMGILSAMILGKSSAPLPKNIILVLNVTNPITETPAGRSLANPFSSGGITAQDLIETLDHARRDQRVSGLIVSLDVGGLELAHIQEIRAAIKRFRASGKFAYIYTASFADLGSGIGAYYLATAFDEIWMQPVGMLSMTGLAMEMPFAKKLLDKVGAQAQFLHREEYKSAMESFTNETISPANKEMSESLLKSIAAQIGNDILADRKLKRETFDANIDKGLITGADALKAGLLTKLDYADAVADAAQKKAKTDETSLVSLEDYYDAAVKKEPPKTRSDVALVRVVGEIVPGDEPEPGYATSDYIADAIDDAAENKHIKVILLRVDSPGGSPTGSETIRHAIVKAKEKGKKIIVSMGSLAASGGYWIVVDADRIFASPSTLTGSIGVIMGKFQISGLWEKLGVNWEAISWGRNARMWSMNNPIGESEMESLNAAIDNTYASFLSRVAEGRKMDVNDVRKIAKGRAWTGLQAKEIGLVDEIGGLDEAMNYAAKQAGVKDPRDLRVIELPEPLTPVQQLLRMMGGQVSLGASPIEENAAMKALSPYLRQADVMERIGPVQAYDPALLLIQP